MVSTNDYLLKVEDLKTYFPIKKGLLRRAAGFIKAVDGVSFGIKRDRRWGWSVRAAVARRLLPGA